MTSSSISLSYKPPLVDGGMPVSSYLVQLDATAAFDPKSPFYTTSSFAIVPEVQIIQSYFRAGDDVKTRGGTFALSFAGKTTPGLPFNIKAYDLEAALNGLMSTQIRSTPAVTVTRTTYSRGYKWGVTFKGLPGDVGAILVDYSLLLGDDPRIMCTEATKGSADIVPGSYTYEVQVISTYALTTISGNFRLNMKGSNTPDISVSESAVSFKQKLESIPTIHTVSVTRDVVSASLGTFAWTITFQHMKHEEAQGAGDIPPFTVALGSTGKLLPLYSARVDVFEKIKGSHPLQISIMNLQTGTSYYARMYSYNDLGYSKSSYYSVATALGSPVPPVNVSVTIASGTSLNVSWNLPTSAAYQVDSMGIELYTTLPVSEVQVITTSGAASLAEIQRIEVSSDENNLAGYFRLSYGGQITQNIKWSALADGDGSVAVALARLPSMSPITVTRDYSRRIVQGLRVTATYLSAQLTVTTGLGTLLARGDLIWVGNEKFYVSASTASSISLSTANLSTPLVFTDPTYTNAKVSKWSYGYTWDVQFSELGDLPTLTCFSSDNWAGTNPVLKVDSVRQGVPPISGTFRVGYQGNMTPPLAPDVSALDMERALEALVTISDVTVARYRNSFGYSWHVTFVGDIGNLNSLYVNDAALSGAYAGARVSTLVPGVAPATYSSVIVPIAPGAISSWSILTGLTTGSSYQVRLRAHNRYGNSSTVVATPSFIAPLTAPSAPFNATIFPMSNSLLKLVWQSPVSTGGAPITHYRVQWGPTPDFKQSSSTDMNVVNSTSSSFCFDINIPVTSSGVPRYAQIYAFNGYQWSTNALPIPRSAVGAVTTPGPVLGVTVIPTSSVGLLVSWLPPDSTSCSFGGDGGSPITQYEVEWDTRQDYGSPSTKQILPSPSTRSFEIGGRIFMTGQSSTILVPGNAYYVRVRAYNALGAGVYSSYPVAVTPADQAPGRYL